MYGDKRRQGGREKMMECGKEAAAPTYQQNKESSSPPTNSVKQILVHLRAAAMPSTQLLLMDSPVAYAALVGGEEFPDVPGSDAPKVPEGYGR
jgi:hypothetical protein